MLYMKLSSVEQQELMQSLAAMQSFLRETFASLTAEAARKRGPGDAFSPVEQVWHLADLEREGFGLRIGRLKAEDNPRLPDFDGTKIAQERDYRSRSLAEGLRLFESSREDNINTLRALAPDAWLRSGTQEGVGAVSLCDMPVFMMQHDQAHRAEIQEWQRFAGRVGDE